MTSIEALKIILILQSWFWQSGEGCSVALIGVVLWILYITSIILGCQNGWKQEQIV
jgi:hypothetical protein